jgi:hypothetical protein
MPSLGLVGLGLHDIPKFTGVLRLREVLAWSLQTSRKRHFSSYSAEAEQHIKMHAQSTAQASSSGDLPVLARTRLPLRYRSVVGLDIRGNAVRFLRGPKGDQGLGA